jgi:hypothetical protein
MTKPGAGLQWERQPPKTPAGWIVAPPDFVGVGAQRSGTTWWHRVIVVHPGVAFQRGVHFKEVHFFDPLEGVDPLPAEYAERYHRHFPRPPGTVTGEWTPRYMHDAWIPPQIQQAAPAARILVMLRDPVDRYISGAARQHRLAREAGRDGATAEEIADQEERGLYAGQMQRLIDTFGRERLLVLQYERCRESFTSEAHRTYEFLGVDPEFVPVAPNAAPRDARERDVTDAERRRLAERYAADVRRLAELLPEIDPELWPNMRTVS